MIVEQGLRSVPDSSIHHTALADEERYMQVVRSAAVLIEKVQEYRES